MEDCKEHLWKGKRNLFLAEETLETVAIIISQN